MKIDKQKYLLAKANNLLDRFRGDEISRRIGQVYPLSAQIAILMDMNTKPEKFQKYLTFRAEKIQEVDTEIEAIEKELAE